MPDDHISSLCVLARMGGGLDFLYHTQSCAGGSRYHSHLPCYEKGKPRPSMGGGHLWVYVRNSNRLEFTPSVLVNNKGFHSPYEWSVEFVENPEHFPDPEHKGIDLAATHLHINYNADGSLISGDEQKARLAELVSAGKIIIP